MPLIPELIGLAAATAALALMYARSPRPASDDAEITQEIPVVRDEPGPEASVWPSPEPYLPRSGAAWITGRGEFVITGHARGNGDLGLVEVPLNQALRRPPIASRVSEDPPPPGCASLAVMGQENCAEGTLRVVTSGHPRSSTTALVVGVNAEKSGPFRLHGRFEVRA
jgi:hypothetical protein